MRNYSILDCIAKRLISWGVFRLYSTEGQRDEFARQVNNETWLSSQIGSGGVSLSKSKPICREEVISIMCVLQGAHSYAGSDSKAERVDYYESKWVN